MATLRNTAWSVSLEVLIIINLEEKKVSRSIFWFKFHINFWSNDRAHYTNWALHSIESNTVSTSIFLHMGIQCFCKTFSLPQHFFFWYGMHCTDEDATKGPSMYYVIWTGWVDSENGNFCWRSVLHLCWLMPGSLHILVTSFLVFASL